MLRTCSAVQLFRSRQICKMPTCCVPGCNKRKEDHPDISFFRLPWNNKPLLKQWLAKLRCKNRPAQEARVCQDHFEEKFVYLDPRYRIAPSLYPNPSWSLTKDAVPTIFPDKPCPMPRSTSLRRFQKRSETIGNLQFAEYHV